MSNKSDRTDFSVDLQLADVLLRLTVLEKVLLAKGVVSKEELESMTQVLIDNISKLVMERLNSSHNLDEFITALTINQKEIKN